MHTSPHRKLSVIYTTLMSAIVLTGCASKTMPFAKEGERVADLDKPVYLMTVSIRNGIRPAYYPQVRKVLIQDMSQEQETTLKIDVDDAAIVEGASDRKRSDYFLRIPLDPGNYRVVGFVGEMLAAPNSKFLAQTQSPLKVSAKGIYYLGHVEAAMTETQSDDDVPAGPALPVVSQTVPGIIKGQWQIQISDRSTQDIPAFVTRFPALKGANVRKVPLASTPDLKVARAYWKEHRACYNNPFSIDC